MMRLKPDFIVPTGDNVYYDNDSPPLGTSYETCRIHWRRIFSLPTVRDFYGQVPGYWEMDDHDFRWDDADPHVRPDEEPTAETGEKIFREQVPMGKSTYRTVRWGKHLEVFLTEGRLYRDRNKIPDTPEKTIWGAEQKAWLKKAILESDADFKVLVSPTPLVGPDYSTTKIDNHVNPGGFSQAGKAFFRWLTENRVKNFYIVCGDRHWQYHSIHPSGYEEFCCGALSDPHASSTPVIPIPGIKQPYIGYGVGGFLGAAVRTTDRQEPELVFTFYNSRDRAQYRQIRTVR
jgi:alkaline phosphatase/alkaline phosphatase D